MERPPKSRKKRGSDEMKDKKPNESNSKNKDQRAEANELSATIESLSLEAIFHPKFENENRNQKDVRRQMKDRVGQGQGYLEVSLKHSGSLLLWSGGQRFYSKNSTENAFTYVGELLLRQHFARAWYSDDKGRPTADETHYQACSDYVEENRLTLAFEVVTAVLGHHGDLPNRDFLILTAVADREGERFLTTAQILEFAQRFRLPHNDVWVYSTTPAVEKLFGLYDSKRETGMADEMIASLNESADARVSSMYPHVEYQGNILEGVVIRYVGFLQSNSEEHQTDTMNRLAQASTEILQKVPPSAPPTFVLVKEPPVLGTDVRQERERLMKGGSTKDLVNQLGSSIHEILKKSQRQSDRRKAVKEPSKCWDIPQLAEEMLQRNNVDNESKRIASVIRDASKLSSRIDYAVFRENDSRLLCMIHVIYDQTFKRYQQKMNENDMHLFRGFCVELGTDGRKRKQDTVMKNPNDAENYNESAYLMLKMKMLPYMVRTFGCRNGLKVVDKGGAKKFVEYTIKLMNTWGISEASKNEWQPFFRAWGTYAEACLRKEEKEWIDSSLPPLTEHFYLEHLHHFQSLYEAGKIQPNVTDSSGSTYRALIVVVAINQEKSDIVGDFVSKHFGGVSQIKTYKELTDEALIEMKVPQGGGLVWPTVLEQGFGPLRKHLKKHSQSVSVVMFGCSQSEIKKAFSDDQLPKVKGMAKGWEQCRCKEVIKLPSTSLKEHGTNGETNIVVSSEFKTALEKLKAVSDGTNVVETRPGALVFYPAIPGCGKSTISSEQTNDTLTKRLADLHSDNQSKRKVITLMGDKVKKKYWQRVKSERLEDSSSLFIADKNAPPSAWTMVGESTGRGWAIPVVLDSKALSTASFEGVKYPNGSFDSKKGHFYPFSLHFLAVCMSRVLARPPNTHPGKLDSRNHLACLIVAKFYGFYRFLSAEEFRESLSERLGAGGAPTPADPIQIPFFKDGVLPPLPQDLEASLIEAVQFQFGCDLKNKATGSGKDKNVVEVEEKLRRALRKHGNYIADLTVDPDTTRNAFIEQVVQHMSELESDADFEEVAAVVQQPDQVSASGERSSNDNKFVHLVAIDVGSGQLHKNLQELAKKYSAVKDFLGSLGLSASDKAPFKASGFVTKTHVTMSHRSEAKQDDMRSRFGPLIGKSVDLRVTGVLWSDRIAALSVELPTTTEGTEIPPSKNQYVHITLWTAKGVRQHESNKLPAQLEYGLASEIAFERPLTVNGKFSFWH